MQISARNVLQGKIKHIAPGAVNTEVTIDVGGVDVVSVITKQSAEALKLKVGKKAFAIVKASDVMIGLA